MLKGKNTEEKIWNFLKEKIINEYGTAGLMGNLYAESGLNPLNLQDSSQKKLNYNDNTYTSAVDNGTYSNFIKDGAGYGLAQWTYWTRKRDLQDYAKEQKVSIGDLEMQLNFLWKEMTEKYVSVICSLRNANSVEQASTIVLTKFEMPAIQSEAVKNKRAEYGQKYYNLYASREEKETMVIKKKTSLINTSSLPNRKIEWIVIHYTAGTTSKAGSALNTANFFMSGTAAASSDYIVDDETVIQYNTDPTQRYTWGVGGSKYNTMSTSLGGQYYNKCTNKNCLNIEVCSNKVNKKTLLATDDDWYFTDKELALTAELVKYLMKKYDIDINHVIMHHQVTGKVCPNPWTLNESRLTGWYDFLAKVNGAPINKVTQQPNSTQSLPYIVKIVAAALNIRKGPGTNYAINGVIKDQGKYTIVEEQNGWGKLKSGAGWISLKYTQKV